VFRVTDLKVVRVATSDADAATKTFQENFGFPVTRSSRDETGRTTSSFLAIGAAEIEMEAPADSGSPLSTFLAERGAGLRELVLEVDDLERATAELSAKGIGVALDAGPDGRIVGSIDPARTHGVRITLVAR
jgi:catechol 2,3-dioxygenase-like lactoylglutathione lyase family enzyme